MVEWNGGFVHWMDENRRSWSTWSQSINDINLSFGVEEVEQDAYIAEMYGEGFWGGEVEALAASVFLKTLIVTLDASSDQATLYEYKASSLCCVVSVRSLGELDTHFLGLDRGVYSRVVVGILRKQLQWGLAHYNLFYPLLVKFVERRSKRKQKEPSGERKEQELSSGLLSGPPAALGIEVQGGGADGREQQEA
eukprot:2041079-Rhodomonas_salina.2